jgi:hypothetical protein
VSRFVTPLCTEDEADDHAKLAADLVYESDRLQRVITVPAGFETDFASVPRLPVVYLAAGGTARKAAVVHDYLYRQSGVARADADAVFLEAMKASGQPAWRATLMWLGVRGFGWQFYRELEPKTE